MICLGSCHFPELVDFYHLTLIGPVLGQSAVKVVLTPQWDEEQEGQVRVGKGVEGDERYNTDTFHSDKALPLFHSYDSAGK